MKKTASLFALALLALAVALSGCGKKNNAASPSPSVSSPAATETVPAEGGAGAHEVTIKATNWKFEPAEIKAKVGDTIKLTLKNEQGAHGIEIADLGVKLKNNESAEVKLDKAGSYEYHCSIQCGQGHDAMKGFIVVE
ncbi:cupredoxin domain-containing protein [Cohnella boryungensis]|jgi:cytochrome c oxidase subunit 2|uniref:Cupredoxin domain-containing protein n=1 Tax=Cohnella boryungensis TaxID=768479 RepID=A0ABV8SD72_9BACL